MIDVIKKSIKKYISPNSITSNALKIYLIQFFTVICGLIGGIIIARVLGPSEKGIFDLFRTLSSFINEIGVLGIGYGFLYYLANKNTPLEKIHGSALVFSLSASVITSLLGFIGLPLWRSLFPGLKDWVLILPFVISSATFYLILWSFVMIGINKTVDSYKILLMFSMITLIVTASLWSIGILEAETLILATATISIINAFVAFFYIYKNTPKIKPDFQLTKNSLTYGSILFLATVANIIHFKVDQVMINYWLGPTSVGIYAVSVSWAERLFLLDGALLASALYKISSSSSNESIHLTNKVFRAQIIISSIGGLVLALFAYPLIIILYGKIYQDAVLPLILLIPGIIGWSISKVHSNMLIYNRGLGSYVTKVAIMGSVVNVVLNIIGLGVLHTNIIGVSIASSISYIIVAIGIYLKSLKISREEL